jgi:cytochrome c-type biogenesis protein CcmH/NrfG
VKAYDPRTIMKAALAARDQGKSGDALALVRKALEENPGHAGLWQVLGLVYRDVQDTGSAAEALREAARLSPDDAKIAHGLARVSLEGGLPALRLFEKAIRLAPGDPDVLLGRAAAELAEGNGSAAITVLDNLLVSNPGWAAGHATLARIRWLFGNRAQFTASYARALAAVPNDLGLWLEYLRTLVEAQLFEKADAAAASARRAVGAHDALNLLEAICASELGDWRRADRLFESLRGHSDMSLTVRHVRHLLLTGRAEEAVSRALSVVDRPDADEIWPYLSIGWRLTGDPRSDWLDDTSRFVTVYDLSERLLLSHLADRLRLLHNSLSYPLGQSVRGGTQTDGPLFARADPEIRELRSVIAETVKTHIERLKPIDRSHPYLRRTPKEVRFAGSWSVRLTGEGSHTNHIHPQGWLSSALYVALPPPEQAGTAPAGWLTIGQPPVELQTDLPPLKLIEPKPGCLAVFPSLMWHGTVPFDEGERLTVAFDVAPA